MHERIAGTSYLDFKNSIWYMMKMFFSIFIFQWVRKRRKGDKKNERHAERFTYYCLCSDCWMDSSKNPKNKSQNGGRYFLDFFSRPFYFLLAIFPEISYELCRIFGIMSPSNLVFLVIIFLLVEKNIYLIYYCISAGRQDWSVISRSCASFQG